MLCTILPFVFILARAAVLTETSPFENKAIVPTAPGQIGINPVSIDAPAVTYAHIVYHSLVSEYVDVSATDFKWKPTDSEHITVTATKTVDGVISATVQVAPIATVHKDNGGVDIILTPELSATLRGLLEQSRKTAGCAILRNRALSEREFDSCGLPDFVRSTLQENPVLRAADQYLGTDVIANLDGLSQIVAQLGLAGVDLKTATDAGAGITFVSLVFFFLSVRDNLKDISVISVSGSSIELPAPDQPVKKECPNNAPKDDHAPDCESASCAGVDKRCTTGQWEGCSCALFTTPIVERVAFDFLEMQQEFLEAAIIKDTSEAKCGPNTDPYTDPITVDTSFVNDLAKSFCSGDLSKGKEANLTNQNIARRSYGRLQRRTPPPSSSSYRGYIFNFKSVPGKGDCAESCEAAFNALTAKCMGASSHVMQPQGEISLSCGAKYSYEIFPSTKKEPIMQKTCTYTGGDVFNSYMDRDRAMDAIENFCTAQDGKVLKSNDSSSFQTEMTFTAEYAKGCEGAGTYIIEKDLCVQYLREVVDGCDTASVTYKHGGTNTDLANCGSFTFHPVFRDVFACYPVNREMEYVAGAHTTISKSTAEDAIEQFCHRANRKETYTLDPAIKVTSDSFIGDTCTQPGMAYCQYYYTPDGKRTKTAAGNILVRLRATYRDMGLQCNPRQRYDIQGESCKRSLRKVMGIEPTNQCTGGDDAHLDLGSFLENADKGCVLWDFWAVTTI